MFTQNIRIPLFAFIFFVFTFSSSHAQKIATFQHIYGTSAFESDNSELASSVLALPDKGFLVAGIIEHLVYPVGAKILIIRTDSLGRQIWANTYSGTGYGNNYSGHVGTNNLTNAVDMILTPEGNVVICSNTLLAKAIFLLKINLNGNLIWSKTFNGGSAAGLTLGTSIINAPGGGYIMCGAFNTTSAQCEAMVIKTDSSGKIIWSNIYYRYGYQGFGLSITSSRSGGYFISGYSSYVTSNNSGYAEPGNYLIMKIDKNGKLIWSGVYSISPSSKSSGTNEFANSILELPDKSVYLFGRGYQQGTIIKFDGTGHLLWSNIYNNTTFPYCYFISALYDSVKKTINIGWEFATSIEEVSKTGVIRIDTSGNIIFCHELGPSSYYVYYNATGHNFLRLPSGDFVKVQTEQTCPNCSGGLLNFFLIKMDSGANTNSCNTSLSSITPDAYPLHYLYSDSAVGISPSVDSGSAVANLPLADELLCSPFVSDFSWKNPCSGQRTQFYDSTYSGAISWIWNFGDSASGAANTSTSQNPGHTYSKIGVYIIKLISSNGTNTDSITKKITIYPSPPLFKYDTLICGGSTITLHATGANNYVWEPQSFLSINNVPSPTSTPNNTITYTIAANSTNGCTTHDTVKVYVDHKPDPPKLEYATVRSRNEIDVTFQKADSDDVKYYVVLKSTNGGAYSQLETIDNLSNKDSFYYVKDSSVNASVDHYDYKIFAVDSCGANGDTSVTHQPMLLSIKPHGCIQTLQLNWRAYLGWNSVKSYKIFRSTNSGQDSLIATLPNIQTNYSDTGLSYKNVYCYKILALDKANSFVSQSNTVCKQTFFPDTPQIFSISKVSTSKTNGTVVIKWRSINKANLAYNELYYSRDGVHFNLLNGNLLPSIDSFSQSGLDTEDSDYYYFLITVDSCGTNSTKSPTSKTMTLNVTVVRLVHTLNWTPYLGFKIKRYLIEKFENGEFVVIDSVPGTDTSHKEFPAACNLAVFYRITTFGYDSGELAMSDTMGRLAIDTTPPNPAKITSLLVLSPNNLQLNFISSDSPDVYQYVVQRAVNGTWATASDFLTHRHGTPSSFLDTINNINNQLCYSVITLDSCLNVARSDTICSEALSGKSLFCQPQITLSWNSLTSSTVKPDSFVVYRSIDNIKYNKIAELPITNLTDVDTDVTAGIRYYYKLGAVYKKDEMSSYSDTISIVPKIIPDADSAQLVYATVLKSDETKGSIYIQWKRAMKNDSNARGYYVYSLNSANGKYALIKDVTDLNDTSYIQSNINTLQDAYKYYIITYNICDVGINSNIHRTVLLKVQEQNLSSSLKWLNYLGVPVKSYSVYKSIDGGPQRLVINTGIDSAYLDSDITCNHNFTYQVQAILTNGEISFSDSVTVKSYDTIKPVTKPINVATVAKTGIGNGKILLNWNAATDNNLEGYNIYRSGNGFNWILIRQQYPGTSLIDTLLDTYDQSYYYKIQPVDSCGNDGPFTIYHRTIYQRASAKNGYNQINWNSYEGWKVKQYLLYKNGVLIDSLANDVFAFKDSAVICNTVYQYLVKAIDSANDTIISASNTDSAKALNHIPPQKVYIKAVTVSKPNKAATISWTPSPSYDVKNYFIFRKSAATGNMIFIDSTTSTSYVDSDHIDVPPLGVGGLAQNGADGDCYYVFTRDHCGNLSDASNQGCIILLNAQNLPGYNQLTWNSYQDWFDGVQSYNVYKNEDSTGWQLIGATSSVQINQFKDSKLGDSTIDFCYQVEAIENQGQYNQLSRSTVECVHQDATVFVPNTFTPYDQDGLNDFFAPEGIHIKSYDMRIYNRWGELIYSEQIPLPPLNKGGIASIPHGWDGTYKGQFVQQGVYIYLITVTDYNGKQSYFKGTITMFE